MNGEIDKFWIDRANEQNNLHVLVGGKHLVFSNLRLTQSINFDQDKNTKETNKAPFQQHRMTPGTLTLVCSVENVVELPMKKHGNAKDAEGDGDQ